MCTNFSEAILKESKQKTNNNEFKYTQQPCQLFYYPHRHTTFRWTQIEGYLAQSIIHINEYEFEHHVANHVCKYCTGVCHTVNKLLAGKDWSTWGHLFQMNLVVWQKVLVKQDLNVSRKDWSTWENLSKWIWSFGKKCR